MRSLVGFSHRYSELRFRVVDLITLGYMGVLGLLVPLFHNQVPGWYVFFAIHFAFVLIGLESIRAYERRPDDFWFRLLRLFYPSFVLLFGFLEIGKLQHMFTGSSWATDTMVQLDLALFGVHPTVWAKQFYNPWLDELMSLFRLLYFVVPFVICTILFRRGKRDDILAAGAIVLLTYIFNYLLFFMFPAVNPRMIPEIAALDTREYTGFVLAAIEHALQGDQGAVTGASFPSAHVSGTIAWTFVAYRSLGRWPGHLMVLISIGTTLATVYLGFHHAVDPIGGIVLGVACYPLAVYWLRRRNEDPRAAAAAAVPSEVGPGASWAQ